MDVLLIKAGPLQQCSGCHLSLELLPLSDGAARGYNTNHISLPTVCIAEQEYVAFASIQRTMTSPSNSHSANYALSSNNPCGLNHHIMLQQTSLHRAQSIHPIHHPARTFDNNLAKTRFAFPH